MFRAVLWSIFFCIVYKVINFVPITEICFLLFCEFARAIGQGFLCKETTESMMLLYSSLVMLLGAALTGFAFRFFKSIKLFSPKKSKIKIKDRAVIPFHDITQPKKEVKND